MNPVKAILRNMFKRTSEMERLTGQGLQFFPITWYTEKNYCLFLYTVIIQKSYATGFFLNVRANKKKIISESHCVHF